MVETLTEKISTVASMGNRVGISKRIKTIFACWLIWPIRFPLHGTECFVWQSGNFLQVEKGPLIPWWTKCSQQFWRKYFDCRKKFRKSLHFLASSVLTVADIRTFFKTLFMNKILKQQKVRLGPRSDKIQVSEKNRLRLLRQFIRICKRWHFLLKNFPFRWTKRNIWRRRLFYQVLEKLRDNLLNEMLPLNLDQAGSFFEKNQTFCNFWLNWYNVFNGTTVSRNVINESCSGDKNLSNEAMIEEIKKLFRNDWSVPSLL